MCIYSLALGRGSFRDAQEGEDLTLSHFDAHAVARGDSDNKIVCIKPGSEVHIAEFRLHPSVERDIMRHFPQLKKYLGQPVSAQFRERGGHGQSADVLMINGNAVPLVYFAVGVKFYLGEKRPVPVPVKLETKLGMDDPSIHLDHKEETPTVARALARVVGLCSITR